MARNVVRLKTSIFNKLRYSASRLSSAMESPIMVVILLNGSDDTTRPAACTVYPRN